MSDIKDLQTRALAIRHLYDELEKQKYGRAWTREELAIGFVGDVGDLMKLVGAKEGIRYAEDVDEKLGHELADCLWSVLVLANEYDVDLDKAFAQTMDKLEQRIKEAKNG